MTTNYLFMGLASHLACILVLSGVVLLLAWAIKNLKKKDLKKAGIWLVVIGLILGALTMSSGGRYGKFGPGWHMKNVDFNAMEDAMDEMMDDFR